MAFKGKQYDIEQFTKDWNDNLSLKDMSDTYEICKSGVTHRALVTLKLRPRFSKQPKTLAERMKASEYYKNHSAKETAEKFDRSIQWVWKVADEMGVVKNRRKKKKDKSKKTILKSVKPSTPDHSVRVLKSVPEGFQAPKRVMGW